jgi:hypothetical protein
MRSFAGDRRKMRLSSWRSDCQEADGVLQEDQSFRDEVAEFRFVNGRGESLSLNAQP